MKKLKELRARAPMSMHELGDKAGVSYNTIYRLEHGKSTAQARTVRKLAAALGVEPYELMSADGSTG